MSPHLSPRGNYSLPSPYSPAGSALTPYYSSPLTPLDDNYFDSVAYLPGAAKRSTADDQDVHVTNQVGNHLKSFVGLKKLISSFDLPKDFFSLKFSNRTYIYI